ncbi:PKD domain-containing protein, partial [Myxococcota bacterium]
MDGRPIAWHNEDLSSNKTPHMVKTTAGYHNIVLETNDGWNQGALNEQGLARFINNQNALGDWGCRARTYISNNCSSLAEVRSYLASKNCNTCISTPVIDRDGHGAMYEIGNGNTFWEYDPNNVTRQEQTHFQTPKLFAVRANLAFTDDQHRELDGVIDGWPDGSSKTRYLRARERFISEITDKDSLTLEEVMSISRDGNPGIGSNGLNRANLSSGLFTLWGAIAAGVKSGEDPKYAVMLVAFGIPDYSIFIPAWVDLSQSELSVHVKAWNDDNIAGRSFALFEDHFDGTADYDDYIHGIFDDVEDNIIDAVKAARTQWLERGNTINHHQEMKNMHNYAAYAAYYTIKSAHATAADGDGTRNCNRPPTITSLGVVANGLDVSFAHDATDPDAGDTVTYHRWRFGDGATVTATATPTHTYSQPGTYQVMAYVGSGSGDRYAANVRFEYITVPPVIPCGDSTCDSST